MKRSCININLKRDEILIKISEDSEQKEIIETLRKKLPELKKFYKEERNPIKVISKRIIKIWTKNRGRRKSCSIRRCEFRSRSYSF